MITHPNTSLSKTRRRRINIKYYTFPKAANMSRRVVALVPSGRFPIQRCLYPEVSTGATPAKGGEKQQTTQGSTNDFNRAQNRETNLVSLCAGPTPPSRALMFSVCGGGVGWGGGVYVCVCVSVCV